MSRPFALTVAVALLAGCQGSTSLPPIDPFGRTTVEPPLTGAVGMRPPAASSYVGPQGDALPASAVPSGTPGAAPSTASPATGSGYQPPGGSYDLKTGQAEATRPVAAAKPGDRVAIPVAARQFSAPPTAVVGDEETSLRSKSGQGSGTPSAVAGTRGAWAAGSSSRSAVALAGADAARPLADRERIVRTIEPRSAEPRAGATVADTPAATSASAPSQPEPRRPSPPEGVINIMDLAPAGATDTGQSPVGSDAVRLVSASEPVARTGTASSSTAPRIGRFSAPVKYGHDPDYGWLRGQLEYSQIDRRWKLRYIPIDGKTDDFGGSVVIADASVLSGYERGDFVEIRGRLGGDASDDQQFAPEFEVRQIKRLAD